MHSHAHHSEGQALLDGCAAGDAHARGRIPSDLHRRLRQRAAAWGILAAVGLSLVYVGVLALANSLEHVASEFVLWWPWMTSLVVGFALQVGLFSYARAATKGTHDAHSGGVVASGGTSTLSMVACCAHHLTDILPAVGMAGAAMFLAMYQSLFLLLGVLSNLVGLVYVLGLLKRHGLYPTHPSVLAVVLRLPFERALLPTLVLAVAVFIAAALTQLT